MFLNVRKRSKRHIPDRSRFRSDLKKILGFRPKETGLYEMAFIHRSATLTRPDGTRINNERLEFLGDAIIDAIVSEYIYRLYPTAPEGFLTKGKARVVSRDTLNCLGLSMGLDRLIISNLAPTDSPRNLYGNTVEALIGAIFLERGFTRASRFFIERVLKKYLNLTEVLSSEADYKSLILEYCQKNKQKLNFKAEESSTGRTGQPLFRVTLEINNETVSYGDGPTKKEAEQEAAMAALDRLGLLRNHA